MSEVRGGVPFGSLLGGSHGSGTQHIQQQCGGITVSEEMISSLFIDYINILYLERSISRNCELYILKSCDQG